GPRRTGLHLGGMPTRRRDPRRDAWNGAGRVVPPRLLEASPGGGVVIARVREEHGQRSRATEARWVRIAAARRCRREGSPGRARPGAAPAFAAARGTGERCDPGELRAWAEARLPAGAVPSTISYVLLRRRAAPDPAGQARQGGSSPPRDDRAVGPDRAVAE